MSDMSNFDHFDLDGRLLSLLVAVHEEGSITRAAARLGVTQSAVSHLLDKLRVIVGDPLFVKSGRGIAATANADELVHRARRLLDEMRAFSTATGFDPSRLNTVLTIAANDLQRDLLLPTLLRGLRARAPGVTLRVIPSGAPGPDLLREDTCHLVLTPRPPDASDILQRRLFEDGYNVYFDAQVRAAPDTLDEYLASEHVSVLYDNPRRALDVDDALTAQGLRRRLIATVPGFAGLAAMIRGGPWLATAPALLGDGVLRGLAQAPLPVATPPLAMYMVWHLRYQHDPMHVWLRQSVIDATCQAMSPVRPADEAYGRPRNR